MPSQTTPLAPDLCARLDAERVCSLLAYLATRLGHDRGDCRLEVIFAAGVVRRAFLARGPLGTRELDELGCKEAPR